EYILKSEEGPYLIASENSLSGLEVELVSLDEEERLKMLSQIIEEIKKDFDIILIDCPPSLGLLSLNALVASDSIIIPIQTEYYALEGVSELLKTYQTIKESIKEDLEIEGVLLCMFDKDTDLSYEVVEEVKSFFKEKVFSTMIPRNIKLAEAPSFGKSVISY
ncbi:MAG: ParA family protein, partial [Anaerococcus obesiensis]